MFWINDFVKNKENEKTYYTKWRSKKDNRWHRTQLKWYYRYRSAILKGWQKPKGKGYDEFDLWAMTHHARTNRERIKNKVINQQYKLLKTK